MTNEQTPAVAPVANPFLQPGLTDAELAKLLEVKPADEVHDGTTGDILGYITDTDEDAEEANPTVH